MSIQEQISLAFAELAKYDQATDENKYAIINALMGTRELLETEG